MVVLVVVFVLVSGLRMAELGHCGDRRTGAGPRRADAARPARRDPRAAPGTGPAPDHTGQGPGRQGVLLTGDPHPDAHARDRRGHPRTGRSTRQPHTPRGTRRAARELRPRHLQGSQRRRTLLRATQAVAVSYTHLTLPTN